MAVLVGSWYGADHKGDVGAGAEVEFGVVAFEGRGGMRTVVLHGGQWGVDGELQVLRIVRVRASGLVEGHAVPRVETDSYLVSP